MSSKTREHEGRRAGPWLRWLARVGIAAEGVIYLLIGGLALAGAFDPTQRPSGSSDAMSRLAQLPLGHAMLALLALGLAAFVLWQLVLAVLDPECEQGRWRSRRIALRLHHLWSAALHCVLVGIAGWQLLGFGHGGHGARTQEHLTAMALRLPGGRWLIGGIGVGIVAFAVVQWVLACRPQKDTRMDLTGSPLRVPVLALLAFGYVARGALFGLIGALLVHAAWQDDPGHAGGIAGALQAMRQQAFGPWLLGAVAAGLIAFGLAQIAKARYRQIRIE
ncbi:MAG TPA: DUF1206 domain-containing protein [Rhodanobacter sp.]|jgi:hypothetical protein|nr:DUF1206 domain-containing protein [Rhodanobacter sp.]